MFGVCLAEGSHPYFGPSGAYCLRGSGYLNDVALPSDAGCGGIGESPCLPNISGGTCTAGFALVGAAPAVCKPCGGKNQPCCPQPNPGVAPGAGYCAYPYSCTPTPTVGTVTYACQQCGGSGQPCCQGGLCGNNLTCNCGTTCGVAGMPCI